MGVSAIAEDRAKGGSQGWNRTTDTGMFTPFVYRYQPHKTWWKPSILTLRLDITGHGGTPVSELLATEAVGSCVTAVGRSLVLPRRQTILETAIYPDCTFCRRSAVAL